MSLTICMTNLPSFLLCKREILIPIMDACEDRKLLRVFGKLLNGTQCKVVSLIK